MKRSFFSLLITVAFVVGCASDQENKNLKKGAGIGAAAGAVIGGLMGSQNGDAARGAIIGAAAGGALGGTLGHRRDNQAKELAIVAETKRTEDGIVTKLKSDLLFETGKSDLKPAAQQNLKEMAVIMKKYPENVLTVNGYTDNTGSAKINEELSQKRAQAVRETLVASGLPAETIKANGLGTANPVAQNDSASGRKQNRRVEIEIAADPSKIPKKAQ